MNGASPPLSLRASAQVCHLSVGLCWNVCERDHELAHLFAENGGRKALMRVTANEAVPASLRASAMGQLLATPVAELEVLDAVLVSFVASGDEELEDPGARGMAFLTQSGHRDAKRSLAAAGRWL